MKLFKYALLCASFSCAANTELEPLENDEGYLVLPVVLKGSIPDSVTIKGEGVFSDGYMFRDLTFGTNFEVIKLPAGSYKWARINVNERTYFTLKKHDFNVEVKPGVINYGGHLVIDVNLRFGTASYDYVNRSSEIIHWLQDCCSDEMSNHPLEFTSSSQDPFIDFYLNIGNGGEE